MGLRRDQFLGLPPAPLDAADAVLLPLPFEHTVSYGGGTAGGPRAILEASGQVETFDEETQVDFEASPRLHTLPPLATPDDPAAALETIRAHAEAFRGRFLVGLGGEHLVTYGLVKGLAPRLEDVTVVQIDAHADLIDELDGRRWSHGTIMRRLLDEGCRIVQIGVRSLSREEFDLIEREPRVTTFFAHDLPARWDALMGMLAALAGDIYLSIDVDGLDPSVIPSTGTPQPDGLSWRRAMDVLRAVAAAPARLLGADVVEFIPSPQPPGCDLTAAKLVMKLLAFRAARRDTAP